MAEEIIQIACKNCGSTDVVKAGIQSGTQRYGIVRFWDMEVNLK